MTELWGESRTLVAAGYPTSPRFWEKWDQWITRKHYAACSAQSLMPQPTEPSIGHEQRLVLHCEDENHITEDWTWRSKGKDSVTVIHFARGK